MEGLYGTTNHSNEELARPDDLFTTETAGLSEATPPQLIRLHDGDRFDLRIEPLRKRLEDSELRMLGYSGSIPGPTLHVDQGSEITVQVTNAGTSRRRSTGTAYGWRTATTASARDPVTHPDRRDLHLQGPVSPSSGP
jgi:hypothetical protein